MPSTKTTTSTKKNGKKPKKDSQKGIAQRLDVLESKVKELKPEYKYQYTTYNTVSGQTADASNLFYANNTGFIKAALVQIPRGDTNGSRIGDEVRMKRIFVQTIVRWPLLSLTPLWNGADATASSNQYKAIGGDMRLDIPVKLSIVRMNHADGAFANFQTYMEGFKRMYTLKENMASAAVKDLKKQELKILASKTIKLKRSLYLDSGNKFIGHLQEVAFNISCDDVLSFNKSPSSDNNPQNYRYAIVCQFGHMADQFLSISKTYAPILSHKWNFYYTDQ